MNKEELEREEEPGLNREVNDGIETGQRMVRD